MRRIRFDVVALAPLCFALACESSVSPKVIDHGARPPSLSYASPIDSLKLVDSVSVSVGHSARLTFQAYNAGGTPVDPALMKNVQWTSGEPGIASIDSTGLVAASALGRTVVSILVDGVLDSVIVNVVSRPVARVLVNVQKTLTLTNGATFQARAVAIDAAGGGLSDRVFDWESSDASVVSVAPDGLLTAKSVGAATITVTSEGSSATFDVTVTPNANSPLDVSLGTLTLQVGQTTQAAIANLTVLTGHLVQWSSSTPTVASVSSSGTVTALSAGSSVIRASVAGLAGEVTIAVTAPPVVIDPTGSATQPALPQFLTTSVSSTPSDGRTLRVASGGDLQQALDSAIAGDRILVAAGATYMGNFHLPAKTGAGIPGGWITVQSDAQLPSEGQRMTPSLAASLSAPKIVATSVLPAISADPGSSRWRIIGLEVTLDPNAPFSVQVIELGGQTVTSTSQIPKNIILDRDYIHGTPTLDVRRCVQLNSDSTAVVDSYLSDCHSRGFDSQAIWGWNGNGPYKVVNNYLEASTEVVGFGGADPSFPGLVPSDIEIRGNQITRPMSYKGGPWLIKNLIELKVGRRVLIDGNVIENSWPQAQGGFAFVLWSVNQSGGCPWCVVENVTVRNNLIRNVTSGFQLSEQCGTCAPATPMHNLAIENNVLVGLDNPAVSGGGYGLLIQSNIAGLSIQHNSIFGPTIAAFEWTNNPLLPNHVVRDNLSSGGAYPLFISPGGNWQSIAGQNSSFAGNVIAGGQDYATNYPAGNQFPASADALGLVGGAGSLKQVIASVLQFALSGNSPFKGKATNGGDPGADMNVVSNATSAAITP